MIQQHWNIDSNSCLTEAQRNVPRPQPVYGNCCGGLRNRNIQKAIQLGAYIPPGWCYQSDSSTGRFQMRDKHGNTTYGTYQDNRISPRTGGAGCFASGAMTLTEMDRIRKAANAIKYHQHQEEQYALSCLSVKGWYTK